MNEPTRQPNRDDEVVVEEVWEVSEADPAADFAFDELCADDLERDDPVSQAALIDYEPIGDGGEPTPPGLGDPPVSQSKPRRPLRGFLIPVAIFLLVGPAVSAYWAFRAGRRTAVQPAANPPAAIDQAASLAR